MWFCQCQSILTELQGKQKFYLVVFLVTINPGETDLGRNLTMFKGGKKRTTFIKTEKEGLLKGLCTLLWKTVIGAGKQTYAMLYRINCLYLLLGEKYIF